jgi:YD repeat-containing protein
MTKKVQNITIYRLDLPPEGSAETSTMDEHIVSKTSYHPDFGKIILEEQYGSSSDLEQSTEFSYDDQGFLIREVLKDADGTVMEEKSYEADEHKRIAREYLHYADGSRDTITYTYDDGGNIIKKETVDADGDTEEIEEFRYENGKLVHELKRDDSGEIIFEKQFHYKDGQLAEEESKDVIEGDAQKRVYTYNEQGHRESVMLYDAEDTPLERILLETDEKGQPVKVVEENRQKKNTLYLRYDDKGNVVFQEEFDLKGVLVSRVERNYDKDGRLMESRIEQNVPSHGINRRYRVRQEYTFG